jgi:hypothetical protein
MSELDKTINKILNLKQNKNKTRADVEKEAQLVVWKSQINISEKFKDTKEQTLSEEILNNYFENYTFENYNQVVLLGTLIYEEILLKRVRDDINAISADENNKFISDKQIQSLHAIEDRVEQLKLKLGISKVDERKDDLTALEEMQEKFRIYQEFNRNEFELMCPIQCPKCGYEGTQMYLLRRRVKDFEILRHPVFYGRWLYSPEMADDIRSGKITKAMAAKYLRTSEKYIEWMLDNEFKIIEVPNIPKEQIDNFVDQNPYLRNAEDYHE